MVRYTCRPFDSTGRGMRRMARLCRYKFGGTCWKCAPDSAVVALFVTLAIGGVGLVALYLWKTMEDPRIGSPLNLLLGMFETLGILRLTSVGWPDSVARMLTMVSLVNFNVEVFQTQCMLGPPHPITGALSHAGSLCGAMVVAVLFWPLLQLSNRMFPIESAEQDEQSLEGACYVLRPDRATPTLNVPLQLSPSRCLRRASFSQYVQIAATVRPFALAARGCTSPRRRPLNRHHCTAGDVKARHCKLPGLVRPRIGRLQRAIHACMAQVHRVSRSIGGLLHC
jgi:hypothetical protein